jgi:UDP-N-acetylmuramate: L-alanyl-gamma-D-glutamyl-meso-diaminopimelate ligase
MHIHIVGIVGVMTAPLAKELIKQGNKVTGSDQEKIYPPFSTLLKKEKIVINKTSITKNIDLAIIGSSFKSFANTQKEFEEIKKLNIPYISATEYISKFLDSKNPILVAGSFGKTTISSLLSWIFFNAKLKTNYMFGGESLNKIDSLLKNNQADYSILEADESINGLDTQAKFLYYPVKYLILTSSQWEHKDSYKTEEKNFNAFKKLVSKLPKDGILVINKLDFNAKKLANFTKAKVVFYNASDKNNFQFETKLIGQHNYENILAATTLSLELGIDPKIIKKAISTYKGIKRRLQLIAHKNNIYFYDDFAQSADRIKSAIESVKNHYPNYKIKVFFEPHASFLQNKDSLKNFGSAFAKANKVVFSKINFNKKIDKQNRVTIQDFKNQIGDKLIYIPIYNDLLNYYLKNLKPHDILIHMSSGGLAGLKTFKTIIKNFELKI